MLLAFDDVIESTNLLKLDESLFEEQIFRIKQYSNELTYDWTIVDDVKTSVMTSQVEAEVPRRPPLPLTTNKLSKPSLPPSLPSNLKPGPPERPSKIQFKVPQPPQQVPQPPQRLLT